MLSNIVIIAIAIMLMMAISVVLFVILYQRRGIRHQLEVKTLNEQKQLALLEASLQSEEEERRRIASELHDDVGASLSSIRLFLHKADEQSGNSPVIQQSKDLIDETIKKVRDISHKLQPATLQMLGLYTSLQALAEIYNRSEGIKVDVRADHSLPRLVPNTELHIYRIIQELINNSIKHSGSSKISINVNLIGENLQFAVTQDGKGIAKEEYAGLLVKKGAIGLKNIENRLKFTNATIEFRKLSESEFSTIILVPVKNKL